MGEYGEGVEPQSTMESIIDNLFTRLRLIAVDVEKVQRSKEFLTTMQRRSTFLRLLGPADDDSIHRESELAMLHTKFSLNSNLYGMMDALDEDIGGEEMSEDMCQMSFEEDRWHSFFPGFEILNSPMPSDPNENRKCVELSVLTPCDREIKAYLMNGVRCFMINLFVGTQRDNQMLIVKLREAEICVSREFGFPVASSILAKMTPRHQYTGSFSAQYRHDGIMSVELPKNHKVELSVDREYSDRCTIDIIYVNARFLLIDVMKYDYILIGDDIQLVVKEVHADYLDCCVVKGGTLTAHMPVLFPSRCRRFRVSYEELEDLTFAREVGINVVISHIVGTPAYMKNLEEAMLTMHCDGMRLFARVVLNEIQGCDGELNWATKQYDGFLVELALPEKVPDIMHLCPNAECFMQLAYESKKPILFNPAYIDQQILRVDPEHYYYTFYYPDKYVVPCFHPSPTRYFSFLQNAIFEQITPLALEKAPYCDRSHTGADTLARAVVTAAMEVQAASIIVIGVTPRMVQKIAHFRPHAPILFVSHMRSAEDYVSAFFNVTMLSFRTKSFITHQRNIFRKAIYALAYLLKRKTVKHNDKVILVYNFEERTTFPEKYIIYKVDKNHFPMHMAETLFPTDREQKKDSLKDVEPLKENNV
ncbi:hypothetical protein KR074_010583 [Drosophila pseudoananassae]|nr:hypothetical protein KR074_010583 [Drosophila pseudoananassae]